MRLTEGKMLCEFLVYYCATNFLSLSMLTNALRVIPCDESSKICKHYRPFFNPQLVTSCLIHVHWRARGWILSNRRIVTTTRTVTQTCRTTKRSIPK